MTDADRLVQAALDVGASVAAAAEPAGKGLAWHAEVIAGVTEDDVAILGHGDVGASLYDGTAGIALGLAACAEAASPREAEPLAVAARGAARHALEAADGLLDAGRLALFDGATGVALGVALTARALGDGGLRERAAALTAAILARAGGDAATDPELDLIAGVAGIVLGQQAIGTVLGEGPDAALMARSSARLIAAAEPQTWGAAWATGGARSGGPPLLGLGHGAAGVALALGELAAARDDTAALGACHAGLEYERGWYDPDRVAWPDLRDAGGDDGEPVSWMSAWCHGAVGIGLSRLRLGQLTGDRTMLAEASAALQAARQLVVSSGTALCEGATSDCTACHGLGGVVELLLVASRALELPAHARAGRRVARLMLEQRDAAGGWPCGLPGANEVPGLMLGTSGIALTLLRAAGAVDLPTPLLPGPSGW